MTLVSGSVITLLMNATQIIDSAETFRAAKVGDYITAAFLESLSDADAAALEAAGITVTATEDGRLVLVDA